MSCNDSALSFNIAGQSGGGVAVTSRTSGVRLLRLANCSAVGNAAGANGGVVSLLALPSEVRGSRTVRLIPTPPNIPVSHTQATGEAEARPTVCTCYMAAADRSSCESSWAVQWLQVLIAYSTLSHNSAGGGAGGVLYITGALQVRYRLRVALQGSQMGF